LLHDSKGQTDLVSSTPVVAKGFRHRQCGYTDRMARQGSLTLPESMCKYFNMNGLQNNPLSPHRPALSKFDLDSRET
jgi:hypothetical protein